MLAYYGAIELGLIYALMALGVYITFRILDFPDLTVDGSFVTGAAVAAVAILNGVDPFVATILAVLAGFVAGCITGLLHTKGKINPLLAGILMMIALYSINLRIMGMPNMSLLNQDTVFRTIREGWSALGIDDGLKSFFGSIGLSAFPSTYSLLAIMLLLLIIIKFTLDYFLKTEVGLAIRATGDNKRMIRSFSANTDALIILALGLSNGLVALSGSLLAQQGGFADVQMGIGMIIIGLASVIIGEALFGAKSIFRATLAIILGAVIYRVVVTFALKADFLDPGDMKLITAVLVIGALIAPKVIEKQREKRKRRLKHKLAKQGGGNDAKST
ncbi:ABC transporter permease [Alkalicoccobacillus murimartini]|uniref:ABC transport system permease protein n=1 Tax=Alkalicoccobacillus murimartini TaxID=171685 RepID=A0ABT9YER3_9BACI|nr:ABC transporter permease [Alkalicoccobacillus murimartini]MDQ0206026.1 putative ABC transport system permease protein [Alkalicoccobacillus murimartini]